MITVKEEWLTDDKTKRAIKAGGYEVVAMWLALKRYCAEHLTDGFIPDEDIDTLPGAPPKARGALQCLVECGRIQRNGGRGSGLVNKVDLGWELHKYTEHANTREQEERRRAKAKERKERYEERRSDSVPVRVPDSVIDSVLNDVLTDDGTGSPARGRARAPSPAQPSPQRKEDPPAPKPKDPMRDHLGGKAAHQRPDVLRIHAAFQKRFGFTGHKFRGYGDLDAAAVAEALDLHGEPVCLRVLEFAPSDGMVSGRDDEKRVKHDSLRYIFGNAQAFARILRAADEAEPADRESTVSKIQRMRDADPGAA